MGEEISGRKIMISIDSVSFRVYPWCGAQGPLLLPSKTISISSIFGRLAVRPPKNPIYLIYIYLFISEKNIYNIDI